MLWSVRVTRSEFATPRLLQVDGDRLRAGRDPGLELPLPEEDYASRLHLVLTHEGGRFFLEDPGSTNGTELLRDGAWVPVHERVEAEPPLSLRVAGRTLLHVAAERPAAPDPGLSRVIDIRQWEREETVMVLDLCGSSSLAAADDRMAFHLKQRLAAIARTALDAHGMRFHKDTGDGFLATFPDPRAGARAGLALLRQLGERNRRSRNPPIHVRIGLHHGKTYVIDPASGDRHGRDVNLAFRLEGLQADQFPAPQAAFPPRDRLLASGAAADRLRAAAAQEGFYLVPCGAAQIKGEAAPVPVYWLRGTDRAAP